MPAGFLAVASLVGALALHSPVSASTLHVGQAVASSDPLIADSVLVVPGGPVLIGERSPGLPVISVRVSAPLLLPWPSAARILVDQAVERASPLADVIGASLSGGIEEGRIFFTVAGDIRDVDQLGWIVRRLVDAPTREAVEQAMAKEQRRLDRLAETPQGRLALLLEDMQRAGNGDEPNSGARYLWSSNFEDIYALWRRSYQREQLRVVVLGDLSFPQLLADLSFLGATGTSRLGGGGSGPVPQPLPQVKTPLYAWSAAAFNFGEARDPAVIAGLAALEEAIRETDFGARVRLVQSSVSGSAWVGVMAQARQARVADAALEQALAVVSDGGLARWWEHGIDRARARIVATAATPEGWLQLTDLYYKSQKRDGLRSALRRLDSLGLHDLQGLIERFHETVFRPRIDN